MTRKVIAILFSHIILATALCAQSAPAMDKHAKLGVTCKDCHGTATAKTIPTSDKCLACHGGSYAALIKASTKTYDIKNYITNPHASHIGETRCTRCHKNHAESVLYCNDCHSPRFYFKTP
jgi:formate-dependent nitrite reductase cytochrome c552 subunit